MPRVDAGDWDRKYAEEGRPWGDEPSPLVTRRLDDARPGRAIDLACGEGRHARWLAGKGWKVTAVDFSHTALQRARELDATVEWVRADVRQWEPRGEPPGEPPATGADLVLITYLQLPMPQLHALLIRAVRWLRPGGRLLYLAHSRSNLTYGAGGPSDAAVLPDVLDLARASAGLRVAELAHRVRQRDAGLAVDIVLDAHTWNAAVLPDDLPDDR